MEGTIMHSQWLNEIKGKQQPKPLGGLRADFIENMMDELSLEDE